MARTLPFMERGRCIDCGAIHNRHDFSYRCWNCYEPRDEMAELQRQFIETQSRMADMLGRMERIQGVQSFPTLRAAA